MDRGEGRTITRFEREKKFIIDNYKTMKYEEIARRLGLPYTTVVSRITKLRQKGLIGTKINMEPRIKTSRQKHVNALTYRTPKEFTKNKKYRVSNRRRYARPFTGLYKGKTNGFHVFESVPGGYKECFSEIDFAIGEYRAEEIG